MSSNPLSRDEVVRRHPARPPGKVLGLLLTLAASILLVVSASAADPLGATLHNDGTTTFRVWAPFVDDVAVRINGGTAGTAGQGGGPSPIPRIPLGSARFPVPRRETNIGMPFGLAE